jgi:hypothetical protein
MGFAAVVVGMWMFRGPLFVPHYKHSWAPVTAKPLHFRAPATPANQMALTDEDAYTSPIREPGVDWQ